MLTLLKKSLYYLMLLALAGIAAALAAGLAWWFDWPLLAGAVIICTLAACAVLYAAGRRLLIWRNKRRYIRDVLDSDPAKRTLEAETGPMAAAWREGMACLSRAPLARRENPVYARPWAILLGREGSGAHTLAQAAAGEPFGPGHGAPLRWHFLPEAVLLEPGRDFVSASPSPQNEADWEDLLAGIASARKREPVNAVIVTMDAPSLLAADAQTADGRAADAGEAVRASGRQIRSRIRDLLAVSSASLPVYVVVTKLDRLPGMDGFLRSLPPEDADGFLGAIFDVDEPDSPNVPDQSGSRPVPGAATPAARADEALMLCAAGVRERIMRYALAAPPEGDVLYAPEALSGLRKGLAALLETLFQPTPHDLSPLLRGVLFTSSRQDDPSQAPDEGIPAGHLFAGQAATGKPAASPEPAMPFNPNAPRLISAAPVPLSFASEAASPAPRNGSDGLPRFVGGLFNRLIPGDRNLFRPVARRVGGGLLCSGLAAWYLLLFAFCGIIAANVTHNGQSLRAASAEAILKPGPDGTTPAALPFLTDPASLSDPLVLSGARIGILRDAERRWWFPSLGLNRVQAERREEEGRFATRMRDVVMPQVLASVTQAPKRKAGIPYDQLRRLLWLQEAAAAKRDTGGVAAMREQPFPAPGEKGSPWTLAFGEHYLRYVDLLDGASLAMLQSRLSDAANRLLSGNGDSLFTYLETLINTEQARDTVPLSRFWPSVPAGSPHFASVPPIYTAKGYAALRENMLHMLGMDAKDGGNLEDQPFWKAYQARYIAAWADFATSADNAWMNVTRVDSLYEIGTLGPRETDPYLRLLNCMATELEPVRKSSAAPAWVKDLFLVHALYELVRLSGDVKPESLLATPSVIAGALSSSSRDLDVLRARLLERRDVSSLLKAIAALRNYLAALQDMRGVLGSNEGSLELARVQFGGKAYGEPEKSGFAQADRYLGDMLKALGIVPEKSRDAQDRPDLGTRSPSVTLLYGPMRFLAHAVTCTAASELQRQWQSSVVAPGSLVPEADRIEALFGDQGLITAFLANNAAPFLNREVGSYGPRRWKGIDFPFAADFLNFAQQGQVARVNAPKDAYDVPIISQTGGVNPDASERLQYAELTLNCRKENFTLRNSNYPDQKVFTYKPAECGPTRLDLSFPSLKLRYEYESFPDFLAEFSYGEREFGPQDFPQAADRMNELGLRRITVRMLPENAAEVLAAQGMPSSPLPERITSVW